MGLFDALESGMTNPLFLGGLGLATNGMQGLQGGMQSGMMYGKQKKDAEKERLFGEAAQQALQDPRFAQLSAGEKQMFAANPQMFQAAMAPAYAHQFDPTAKLKEQQIAHGMRHQDAQLAEQKRAHDLQYAQLKHQNPDVQLQAQMAARARAAVQAGLTPDSPAFKAYYLTGKMPREDQSPLTASDKKAILEADQQVMTNETTIENMGRAKELSKDAYSGPLAGARGYVGSLFGLDSANKTVELDNLIGQNTLGQLKAVFGANPSNAERAALEKLQGSSNAAPQVRQALYDDIVRLANIRLKFNKDRAQELRGGDYFKAPKGSPNATKPQTEDLSKLSTEDLLKRLQGGR